MSTQQIERVQTPLPAGIMQNDIPLERLFNEREACEFLGISRTTINKLRTTGKIDFVIVSERVIRFTKQYLVDYVSRNTPKAKTKAKK